MTRLAPARTVRLVLYLALILGTFLTFFAVRYRVAIVKPHNYPADGTLPLWVSVIAVIFCSFGISVILALLFANHQRLIVVFRPRFGKVVSAFVLGSLFPVFLFDWMPMVPAVMIVLMWVDGYGGWVDWAKYAVVFSIILYPFVALLISGIRRKSIRFAAFLLLWWTLYFGRLLVFGFQSSGL